MTDARPIEITTREAPFAIWALKYVAQNQGETHLRRLREDPTLEETGFSERAELLLGLAHRIETEFNLNIFGFEKDEKNGEF